MAVVLNDLGGLTTFDCGETQNIGSRWKRWLRAFEFFAEGKGIGDAKQKRSLLLHAAGMPVQDIYHTLTVADPGEESDVYKETVKALDGYFTPQVNVPFERHVFRNMEQKSNESVEQYITRLREKATTCEFDEAKVNEQIRDQVIEKCASHKLRLKLLEKGKNLTLKQVSDIARAMEQALSQASAIEGDRKEVNKLSSHKGHMQSKPVQFGGKNYSKPSGYTCYSCGREGHKSGDMHCPARGKQCRFCRGNGHFDRCCLKKKKKENYKKDKPRRVHQVGEDQAYGGDDDHAFMINLIGKSGATTVDVKVGGVEIPVISTPVQAAT